MDIGQCYSLPASSQQMPVFLFTHTKFCANKRSCAVVSFLYLVLEEYRGLLVHYPQQTLYSGWFQKANVSLSLLHE
jgi:hypothetical protein